MYWFQTLEGINLQQLVECFNLAFSDYEQPIRFTESSLQHYLAASGVDLSLSFGAFCADEMVGFILNAHGIYHAQSVVFDAGTGVIPAHRGKKVFSELFDYTVAQLRQRGVTRYCLEVLQSNQHALSIYQKKGFSIQRGYSVLTASGAEGDGEPSVTITPYQTFAPFETVCLVDPSFEHTTHNLDKHPELYEVRALPGRAYCVYAKRNGAIVQMHYNDLDALQEVMGDLIRRYPSAMAKNVDYDCPDVIEMLTRIGFQEILRQYEMARDI